MPPKQTYETTPLHRRPKFYPDEPETLVHDETKNLGHGGNPARNRVVLFRCSFFEKNELFNLASEHRVSASYLIRTALEKEYPHIFINTNHNIKPPATGKKKRQRRQKTIITTPFIGDDRTPKIMSEDDYYGGKSVT